MTQRELDKCFSHDGPPHSTCICPGNPDCHGWEAIRLGVEAGWGLREDIPVFPSFVAIHEARDHIEVLDHVTRREAEWVTPLFSFIHRVRMAAMDAQGLIKELSEEADRDVENGRMPNKRVADRMAIEMHRLMLTADPRRRRSGCLHFVSPFNWVTPMWRACDLLESMCGMWSEEYDQHCRKPATT